MATTLQRPVAFSTSAHKQHHKMSIAFLAGQVNDNTERIDHHCAPAPTPSPFPVTAHIFRTSCYQAGSPGTPTTLRSVRLNDSPYSKGPHPATPLLRISSSSSINTLGSEHSANSRAGRATSYPSIVTSSLSSIDTSPVKGLGNICESGSVASVPTSAITYHNAYSFDDIDNPNTQYHHHQHRIHRAHASMMAKFPARIRRPTRPSYNEEQKFFVVYYRVIKGFSWPEIEDKFASFFSLRTKDGLTSVY